MKNFLKGIYNLIFFFKVIYKHHAYDYVFTIDLILRDLEYKKNIYEKLLKEDTGLDNILKENLEIVNNLIYLCKDYLNEDNPIMEDEKYFKFMTEYRDNLNYLWY